MRGNAQINREAMRWPPRESRHDIAGLAWAVEVSGAVFLSAIEAAKALVSGARSLRPREHPSAEHLCRGLGSQSKSTGRGHTHSTPTRRFRGCCVPSAACRTNELHMYREAQLPTDRAQSSEAENVSAALWIFATAFRVLLSVLAVVLRLTETKVHVCTSGVLMIGPTG